MQSIMNIAQGGLIAQVAEGIRQQSTGDDKYFRSIPYFFELNVPNSVGLSFGTTFLFPLPLNPTDIIIDEPFAATDTTSQGGGLFVEENGIVKRRIRIEGHTGWAVRPYRGSQLGQILSPEKRSFSRKVALDARPKLEFSGQRHFQFLNDAIFRTYADLKKDPSTARETRLLFHNPKDDEHWVVSPQNFRLHRRVLKRVYYEYTIDMLAVEAGAENNKDFSEDKSLIDAIKDVFRTVQSAIDLANGAIRDLSSVRNVITGIVNTFTTTVNNLIGVLDNAAAFAEGTSNAITSSAQRVLNIAVELDQALEALKDAEDVPDQIRAKIRQMIDATELLLLHPENFQTKANRGLEIAKRRQELTTQQTRSNLLKAAQEDPPNSFQAMIKKGTGLLPGDFETARSELGVNRAISKYNSAQEYELTSTDSLESLAAHFLGDSGLWQHLAILNNLRAPYITEQKLPNTLRIGEKILIPSFSKAVTQQALVPVLGVAPSEPLELRYLGTDYLLESVGPGLVDWVIDDAGGSTDLKTVSGVPNLSQAIITRSELEQGHDTTYRTLGRKRIVGLSIPGLDIEIIRFRIAEAIEADPRISTVRSVSFQATDNADTITARVDAEIRPLRETAPVVFELRG